jgi:hypothetical protein
MVGFVNLTATEAQRCIVEGAEQLISNKLTGFLSFDQVRAA